MSENRLQRSLAKYSEHFPPDGIRLDHVFTIALPGEFGRNRESRCGGQEVKHVFRYRHFAVLCLVASAVGCSENKEPIALPEASAQLLPVNPRRVFSDEKYSDLCAEIVLGYSEEEQLAALNGAHGVSFEQLARGACKCVENKIRSFTETHDKSDPALNSTRAGLLKAHLLFSSALLSPSYREKHLNDIQELNDELHRRLALEFSSPEEGVTQMHHMIQLVEAQKNVDGCFE